MPIDGGLASSIFGTEYALIQPETRRRAPRDNRLYCVDKAQLVGANFYHRNSSMRLLSLLPAPSPPPPLVPVTRLAEGFREELLVSAGPLTESRSQTNVKGRRKTRI